VSLVQQVPLDRKAILALQAAQDPLVQQGHKVKQDLQDRLVLQATLAPLVQPVLLGLLARKVLPARH
jgi:hypothetical protein